MDRKFTLVVLACFWPFILMSVGEMSEVKNFDSDLRRDISLLQTEKESVEKLLVKLDEAEELVSKLDNQAGVLLGDFDNNFDSPLKKLRIMDRYTRDWRKLEDILTYARAESILLGRPMSKRTASELPIQWLLRLQNSYWIGTYTLSQRRLPVSKESKLAMTADDCFEMAAEAYEIGDNYHCTSWVQATIGRVSRGESCELRLDTLKQILPRCHSSVEPKPWWDGRCRTDQPRKSPSHEVCRLKHDTVGGRRTYVQYKVEILSNTATERAALIRGVFSAKELQIIVSTRANRSSVINDDMPHSGDERSEELELIRKRCEIFLPLVTARPVYGQSYTFIWRTASVDYIAPARKKKYAGFTVYMGDPLTGGTVFRRSGITVSPSAGSVLVYEVMPNSLYECPVLNGAKVSVTVQEPGSNNMDFLDNIQEFLDAL